MHLRRAGCGPVDQIDTVRGEDPFSRRSFASLSSNQQALRRVRQWLTVAPTADLEQAEVVLGAMDDSDSDPAERYMAKACLLAFQAQGSGDAERAQTMYQEAVALCRWQLRLSPDCASAQVNCGEFFLALGDSRQAKQEFEQAVKILQERHLSPGAVEGPYFPRSFDAYTVEMERHWAQADAGSEARRRQVADLLQWRCQVRLAAIALEHDEVRLARSHAQTAASLRPELGPSWSILGRCHRAAGDLAEAATAYYRAYELAPMQTDIWLELLTTLAALGATSQIRAIADDMRFITDGCPNLADMKFMVERFAAASISSMPVRTLLAAPNWRSPDAWKPLVGEFVNTFRREAEATLALLVDPKREPDLERVIGQIRAYLEDAEGIPESEWPDLHVIHRCKDALDLLDGTGWIEAVCPPGYGPGSDWMPNIPRMTVKAFHLAFLARRPLQLSMAA
jgi:Cytochrome c biogenesis factor